MVYGLWQSAAGLQVQEYRQAIVTNNLANADTPGFKADRIAFQERLNAATAHGDMRSRNPVTDRMTGGLFATPVYTDFAQGSFISSNNPMDVAVDGDGFFTVQTKDGPQYTRDGRFSMNTDGALIHSASGGAVLGGRRTSHHSRSDFQGLRSDRRRRPGPPGRSRRGASGPCRLC